MNAGEEETSKKYLLLDSKFLQGFLMDLRDG